MARPVAAPMGLLATCDAVSVMFSGTPRVFATPVAAPAISENPHRCTVGADGRDRGGAGGGTAGAGVDAER